MRIYTFEVSGKKSPEGKHTFNPIKVGQFEDYYHTWGEILFQLFYWNIHKDGGDGAGAIVCDNFKETADEFVKWYCRTHKKEKFYLDKDESEDTVNFHDCNENYMFTNNSYISLCPGDTVYYVDFELSMFESSFIIKPVIKNNAHE